MGIEGLLQALKPIRVKKNIQKFEGLTAAVDVSTWLYKGTYSCAFELAQGEETNSYLRYTLKMIRLLRNHKITPIMVFDGLTLPLKEENIKQRKEEKLRNKIVGDRLRDEGRAEEANAAYSRSISVGKTMVYKLIDILDAIHVSYIVSPYEADAELAYLCMTKKADFAISEDSDLLVYGCSSVVFKLEPDGSCEHVALDAVREGKFEGLLDDECLNEMLSLSPEKFMELCIVAGCDYQPNIPGFGLKRALKMLSHLTLEETLGRIRYKKQYMGKIPEGYKEKVRRIKFQFLYGRVIDPVTFAMTTLRPLPENTKAEDTVGLGAEFPKDIVELHAKGLYNYKKHLKRIKMSNEEAIQLLRDVTTTPGKPIAAKRDANSSSKTIPAEATKASQHKPEEEKSAPPETKAVVVPATAATTVAEKEEIELLMKLADEQKTSTVREIVAELKITDQKDATPGKENRVVPSQVDAKLRQKEEKVAMKREFAEISKSDEAELQQRGKTTKPEPEPAEMDAK